MAAYDAEKTAMTRFDAAMQSSPNGFVIYESLKNPADDIVDFRCVYANRHAMEMIGLPGEVCWNIHCWSCSPSKRGFSPNTE